MKSFLYIIHLIANLRSYKWKRANINWKTSFLQEIHSHEAIHRLLNKNFIQFAFKKALHKNDHAHLLLIKEHVHFLFPFIASYNEDHLNLLLLNFIQYFYIQHFALLSSINPYLICNVLSILNSLTRLIIYSIYPHCLPLLFHVCIPLFLMILYDFMLIHL